MTRIPGSELSALQVEYSGPICTITMNRPESRNAADADMHRELADVWDAVAADTETRCVILTGAGRAFSAGGDFPRMIATQEDQRIQDEVFAEADRTVRGMVNLPQPIIAAVNGPAVGLGASLVALSDLAVASERAYLADPHLGVGLVPADGAAMIWPLLIGLGRAKEFVYFGDRIPADRAVDLGLVTRVVPQEDVLPTARKLAAKLCAVPREAMQDTRFVMNHLLREVLDGSLPGAIAAERRSVNSAEHKAAVRALMDRR